MEFKLITIEEYNEYIEKQNRIFITQRGEYGEIKKSDNYDVEYIGAFDKNNEVYAVALVIYVRYKKFFKSAECNHGPVMQYNNEDIVEQVYSSLIKYMKKKKKVIRIRISPIVSEKVYDDIDIISANEEGVVTKKVLEVLGFKRYDKEFEEDAGVQLRFIYTKDIKGMSHPMIIKSLSQPTRYEINKANKLGIKVRFLNKDEINIFKDIMMHTKERTGMSTIAYPEYIDKVLDYFGEKAKFPLAYMDCDECVAHAQNQINLLNSQIKEFNELLEKNPTSKKANNKKKEATENIAIAEKKIKNILEMKEKYGNIINMASSLFIYSGNEIIYFLSGAYDEFRQYGAVYSIHNEMLKEASKIGISYYNFFGTTGKFTEEASDYGVLQFKRGFKGYIEEFVGTYDYSMSNIFAKLV